MEVDLKTQTVIRHDLAAPVSHVAVTMGPDEGLARHFEGRVITVGSGPTADLVLRDRQVSRLHCELSRDGAKLHVRDLGSKNGTWLGGYRIVEAEIDASARIRIGGSMLEARVESSQRPRLVWTGGDRFGELVGQDPAMQELFATLARVAPTGEPVVVAGESGTGKELVARALHDAGPRRGGPFVVVDGAALSTSLADLELFGHVRGAFTGAHVDRAGAFERARGGTLFLDELGEIPLEIQPKLLRAIEARTVRRIGGSEDIAVDVRVVAASNKPLHRMVAAGTFREDLYHRLAVIQVEVPPLRRRMGDVPLIARALLARLAPGDVGAADTLERALTSHAGHAWPGNVRELRGLVRRVVALGEHAVAGVAEEPEELPFRVDLPYAEAKKAFSEAFERRYIARLLDETGGNVAEAARRAGMNRSHLSTLVTKLGLRR
jgi:DNA-binding NtrC family response regulator